MTGPSRLAGAIYRALLFAYPAEFRRTCGRDAVDLFAELHRDTRGATARVRLWTRTVPRVLRDGWRERRAGRPREARRAGAAGTLARFGGDVVRGARSWRREPAQAAIAMASLAVGAGATAAIVSLMLALFARAPAVPDPATLVTIGVVRGGSVDTAFTAASTRHLAAALTTLDSLAADRFGWAWLRDASDAEELEAGLVSFNYFDVLRLTPAAGRLFTDGDRGRVPAHGVVVISDALWARRFGRAPGAIGATVDVNDQRVQVIGVAPAGFRGPYAGQSRDLWMPHDLRDETGFGGAAALRQEGGRFDVIGRIAAGSSVAAMAAELATVLPQLHPRESRDAEPARAFVEPVRGVHPAGRASHAGMSALSAGVAGALMLLTCVNVAGLLLARNLGRAREFATRQALGESTVGLLARLVAEPLALAAGAVVLSLPIVFWLQRLMPAWLAYDLPGLDLRIHPAVVATAAGVAVVAALSAGLLPAASIARRTRLGLMNANGPRVVSGAGRGQRALVAAQVALSLMLLAGATVMTRTMTALAASAGGDPSGVLHYRLRPSRAGYTDATASRFQRDILERLATEPSVRAAALATVGPDRGWCCPVAIAAADGPGAAPIEVEHNVVTGSFFETLRIALEEGRGIEPRDDGSGPGVVVVNRALADRLWPGTSAVGRRVRAGDESYAVIGVARDVHPSRPGEGPLPYAWFAFWQRRPVDARLFVRYEGAATETSRRVLQAIEAAGSDVHVGQVGTLLERVRLTHAPQRALARVFQVCAALGLVLTAIGVYGQLSVAIGRGRREIAIRLALGATPRRARMSVLASTFVLVAAGAVLGLAAAWVQARWLDAHVLGVRATDPGVLAASVAVLVAIGVASAVPAARAAARVDPMSLLRGE